MIAVAVSVVLTIGVCFVCLNYAQPVISSNFVALQLILDLSYLGDPFWLVEYSPVAQVSLPRNSTSS